MTGKTDPLSRGRALSETMNPGMERALEQRYDDLLPGFAESVVEMTYGRVYDRPGLDKKTRMLATVAGLSALGGQTAPQLRVHIAGARRAGASEREIAETIFQMGLYGGFPAMINALNVARDVFAEQEASA